MNDDWLAQEVPVEKINIAKNAGRELPAFLDFQLMETFVLQVVHLQTVKYLKLHFTMR